MYNTGEKVMEIVGLILAAFYVIFLRYVLKMKPDIDKLMEDFDKRKAG